MKTTETRQTAMQAMDIYLSAAHRPETLRVTKSGKVEIVGRFTALFGRLARAINLTKNIDQTTINWESKAREAISQKMIHEVALIKGEVSRKEGKTLNGVLQHITSSGKGNPHINWRDQLSEEISALRKNRDTEALASALKNMVILDSPENAAVYPYVRKQLRAGENFSEALKGG